MITDELRQSLNNYISENYIESAAVAPEYVANPEQTKDAGKSFVKKDAVSLDQLVSGVGESFHDTLFRLIQESGMTEADVYKRANIDRKLFSKIRSNPAYHPRKHTVLALAIALNLNIDDTVDLLARAEYALSPGSKGDLIVKYFIEQGVYDIMTINYALDEYGEDILG